MADQQTTLTSTIQNETPANLDPLPSQVSDETPSSIDQLPSKISEEDIPQNGNLKILPKTGKAPNDETPSDIAPLQSQIDRRIVVDKDSKGNPLKTPTTLEILETTQNVNTVLTSKISEEDIPGKTNITPLPETDTTTNTPTVIITSKISEEGIPGKTNLTQLPIDGTTPNDETPNPINTVTLPSTVSDEDIPGKTNLAPLPPSTSDEDIPGKTNLAPLPPSTSDEDIPGKANLNTLKSNIKEGESHDYNPFAGGVNSKVMTAAEAMVESLNPLRIQPKVMTGARAVIKINGIAVAYANSISYTINTDWVELSGIDDDYPNELAPGMVRVNGTINVFRIPNNSPAQQFWQTDMLRGRVWPYSAIEVRDKKSDNLIIQFPRIAITQRSENIQAGQAMVTQLSFISIGYRDELSPQLPTEEAEQGGLVGQFKRANSYRGLD